MAEKLKKLNGKQLQFQLSDDEEKVLKVIYYRAQPLQLFNTMKTKNANSFLYENILHPNKERRFKKSTFC